MLVALLVLLLFHLLGEVLVQVLLVPLPGAVVGMVLLFLALLFRGSVPLALVETAQGLLRLLGLFFVPAGVGILVYGSLLEREWPAMLGMLLGSTFLALIVTALVMQWLLQRSTRTQTTKDIHS